MGLYTRLPRQSKARLMPYQRPAMPGRALRSMSGAAHSSPSRVPTLDTKAGAWSQGGKNSTFIHPRTQTICHTPLISLALSPHLLKIFPKGPGLPGITCDSHCPLDRGAGAQRGSESLEKKYPFTYWPWRHPPAIATPRPWASFLILPLLPKVAFDDYRWDHRAAENHELALMRWLFASTVPRTAGESLLGVWA